MNWNNFSGLVHIADDTFSFAWKINLTIEFQKKLLHALNEDIKTR